MQSHGISTASSNAILKAKMKEANITYAELAERLKKHGLKETEAGITMKLKRGTFAATFLLACLAALELGGVCWRKSRRSVDWLRQSENRATKIP